MDIDIVFVEIYQAQLPPLAPSIMKTTKCGEIPQLPCHPVRLYPWVSVWEKDPPWKSQLAIVNLEL